MEPIIDRLERLSINTDDSYPEVSDELREAVQQAGETAIAEFNDQVAFIGPIKNGKRRVLVLTSEQLPFEGAQGSHFYKAYKCRFSPDGTAKKMKEVVAIVLPNNEITRERVEIMKMLPHKDLFPKNYGFFSNNEEQLVFQERARYDLLQMHEQNELHNLPFEKKKAIAGTLLMAALTLKYRGIIHRDIKSENVLVYENVVKLSDLGHAHLKNNEKAAGNNRNAAYVSTGISPLVLSQCKTAYDRL